MFAPVAALPAFLRLKAGALVSSVAFFPPVALLPEFLKPDFAFRFIPSSLLHILLPTVV
jgi:hypothetical protein